MKTSTMDFIGNSTFSNHSNSNHDNATSQSPTCVNLEENLGIRIGVIILYCVIFLTSLLGNSLIVVTVYRTRRMRTAANLFIANMAASDVIQPIFGVPRVIIEVLYGRETWLISGTAGEVLCKLAYFAQDISLSVSILSLVGITIERFYAVMYPLKVSFLKSHVHVVLPLTWLTAASMHAIYFHVFRLKPNANSNRMICYQLWPSPKTAMVYYLVCFAGVFLLALLSVIILYAMIIVRLKRRRAANSGAIHVWTVRKAREAQERKILHVAVAITVVFFACFFPQVILVIAAPLNALPYCSIETLRFVTKIMEQSYAAFNPIICLLCSQNYRDGFINALTSCCQCSDRFSPEEESHQDGGGKKESDYGEMAMTPLAIRASIRRGLTLPCAVSSPALMRAEGVVKNK